MSCQGSGTCRASSWSPLPICTQFLARRALIAIMLHAFGLQGTMKELQQWQVWLNDLANEFLDPFAMPHVMCPGLKAKFSTAPRFCRSKLKRTNSRKILRPFLFQPDLLFGQVARDMIETAQAAARRYQARPCLSSHTYLHVLNT